MIKKYKIMTNRILNYMIDIEDQKRRRLVSLRKYDNLKLKEQKRPSGKSYYSSYRGKNAKGEIRYKYIGDRASNDVLRIKEVHHLKKALAVLAKNVELLDCILKKLEDVEADHINDLLPAVYRTSDFRQEMSLNRIAAEWKRQREAYKATFPPFHPEELTVPTLDNTMVRSKSEALIYNFFLSLGLTFIYELPLETEVRTFFPDFTILSEIDYRSVYRIEHQGMMSNDEYSELFKDRVCDYLRAGYVQGVNIFFTFDFYKGGVDLDPILDIVRLKIRPNAQNVYQNPPN